MPNAVSALLSNTADYVHLLLMNPLVIIAVFIAIVYMIWSPGTTRNVAVVVIVSLVLVYIFFKLYNIQMFLDLEPDNKQLDVTVNVGIPKPSPVPEIKITEQVFNIPNNDFVYEDAKAICKAYGARLATYDEVEQAYNEGGEWCNYGWSDGQMALFPTQKRTFDKLQTIEGHEHDCGRPGVNGGYMANPHLRFGVNCYGYKPRMTSTEQMLMETEPLYPKTEKDIALEKRVNYWRDKLSEVLVSPFNHMTWSRL